MVILIQHTQKDENLYSSPQNDLNYTRKNIAQQNLI